MCSQLGVQDCCARSRMLVERGAYDEFVKLFTSATGSIVVEIPLDAATTMGLLRLRNYLDKVESFLDIELDVVARRRRTHGSRPLDVTPHRPDPPRDHRFVREEIFRPIVTIIPFDDEADPITLANDTIFGLSGSVWTRDVGRAIRVSRGLETGSISVNSSTSVRLQTPFGGFKQSGIGRELGMTALDGYTELKNIFISTDG